MASLLHMAHQPCLSAVVVLELADDLLRVSMLPRVEAPKGQALTLISLFVCLRGGAVVTSACCAESAF